MKIPKNFDEYLHVFSRFISFQRLMWHPELTMIFGTRRHEHFEAQVSSREVAEKSLDKVMQVVLQCSRIFATGTNLQRTKSVVSVKVYHLISELKMSCFYHSQRKAITLASDFSNILYT